ncbi:hypothetical protein PEDI_57030 [Persicobacter diffluens]|uniref:Initiator Rep protein WH1 domain-containing protein n=1 Tax=Persicobacter diffluens TaxID=981 RepID=A0AAN4W3U7_9BACT|nr:hypothetical protein PEDI_57030 [Persicobacter diffluens]
MAQNGELDLPTDERGRQYVPLFPRDFFGGEKVNGRALQQIKEQLGDLTGISVFLRIQTEEMEEERRIPIASAVRGYRDRKTKKTVEGKEMQVSLSPEIVEMFIKQWDKGNFTQYLYEKVRDFRVGSAFKLYEVLLQHLTKNRLQHGQVKFSVEMLGKCWPEALIEIRKMVI